MMKDIGLGPSIYLLTLKALAKLFLVLTLINIPVAWLYYSGQENQNYTQVFSIGNLGQNDVKCHNDNLGQFKQSISLECNSGYMHRLIAFGLNKETHQCHNVLIHNEDLLNEADLPLSQLRTITRSQMPFM